MSLWQIWSRAQSFLFGHRQPITRSPTLPRSQSDELESLRKDNVRWPEQGEIYQLKRDKVLGYLTHWGAPYTGSGVVSVKAGTKISVTVLPKAMAAGATAVRAAFLNHKEMEVVVVPESERTMSNYGGYSLCVTLRELHEDFSLIGNEHNAQPA
jgi:hypothetical protein